jgi:hypothetical protein
LRDTRDRLRERRERHRERHAVVRMLVALGGFAALLGGLALLVLAEAVATDRGRHRCRRGGGWDGGGVRRLGRARVLGSVLVVVAAADGLAERPALKQAAAAGTRGR